MNKSKTAAFDVDGTLIKQSNNGADVPRYEIIEIFRTLQSLGFTMVVWSGGGFDYARNWVDRLGLDAQVLQKGSFKPDLAFDDQEINLGVINIRV